MALPNVSGEFRLVAEPELKFTGSGKQVVNVRLAANTGRKDPQTGEWVQTDQLFLNASVWDKDGEALIESGASKGDRVLASGALATREYDKSDGSRGLSVDLKFAKVALIAKKGAQRQDTTPAAPAPVDDPWAVPSGTTPPF